MASLNSVRRFILSNALACCRCPLPAVQFACTPAIENLYRRSHIIRIVKSIPCLPAIHSLVSHHLTHFTHILSHDFCWNGNLISCCLFRSLLDDSLFDGLAKNKVKVPSDDDNRTKKKNSNYASFECCSHSIVARKWIQLNRTHSPNRK